MAEHTSTLLPGSLTSKQRYIFIDLYRSAVILLMLEGHVFRAFLPTNFQREPLFLIHEFFHGLSAPAFLFGAGLTFVISTRRRWEDYHHWDPPLAKRLRRLLLVLALGYALHLPFFSLRKTINESAINNILTLFQFDVLHCIGIGLLSLHAIIFFFKKETKFYGLVFSTIVLVCFITPLIWEIDFLNYIPPLFSQMFNGNQGSPFPLFPYVGFLFAGVIVSWEFLMAVDCNNAKTFMYRLAAIGMILMILGVVFDEIPIQIYPTYNYWFTSPNYFLLRTGSLMTILSMFWYLGEKLTKPKKIFTVLGIESLFVYVLHLPILYGSVINSENNLQKYFGLNLTLLQTSIIFIALLAFMLILALLWNFLKEKHYKLYRFIQFAAGGILLILFLFKPY